MVQHLVREQDQDLWLFINQFKRKFMQLVVVDLLEETCYELTDRAEAVEMKSYSEWLHLFIETEVEPEQQSQLNTLLKPDNIVKAVNSSKYLIKLMYHNRLDINRNLYRRLWIVLLDNDGYGIPKRVLIAQEQMFTKSLVKDPNRFNSEMFGAAKFLYEFDSNKLNRRFQYLDVNNHALQIFGYTSDEFYEEVVADGGSIICPADYPNLQDDLNRLNVVGDKQTFCYDIINRGGYLVKIKGEMELCADEREQKFVQALFYDNSDNEEIKVTVKQLTSEIDNIARTIPGAIHRSLITGKNSIHYVSPYFKVLTGYDINDIRIRFGENIKGMIADQESSSKFDSAFSRALTSNCPVDVDFRIKTAGGDIINVRDWLYITHDQNDKLWLYGYMQDITNEKKLQKKADSTVDVALNTNSLCSFIHNVNNALSENQPAAKKRETICRELHNLTGGTVHIYHVNNSNLTAKIECSTGDNPAKKSNMVDARVLEEFFDHSVSSITNCRLFSNVVILKNMLIDSTFQKLVSRSVESLIVMPFQINHEGQISRMAILENPAKWLFQEQFAKTINSFLSMSYPK